MVSSKRDPPSRGKFEKGWATRDGLYSVLRREKKDAFKNLESVYGLGTEDPSPFALELLSRLHLKEGCQILLQSERQMAEYPPDSFDAPRHELESSIASLNCR